MNKEKVIVGMSGGVDSSVCAYLLKEEGYDVIGVTMDFWHDDEPEDIYRNLEDAADAKAVCEVLGIPHIAMNFTKEFRKNVEEYFRSEYVKGRTPNPCIRCNETVKWGALLEKAEELGVEYIATGHYARIDRMENGRLSVKNSVTAKKDQTYVLYRLSQEQLRHTLMPIGEYEKDEIRKIAEQMKLPVAAKKDSQDICFIDDGDYAGYLKTYENGSAFSEGDFVLLDGTVVGRHKGLAHYTVGQRKGLGIALGKHVFVHHLDVKGNRVVLCDNEDLFTDTLYAGNIRCMAEERFDENKTYMGKIRYSHTAEPCRVSYEAEDRIKVVFENKVRAVTPGQSVVLYTGDYVAGGGEIE